MKSYPIKEHIVTSVALQGRHCLEYGRLKLRCSGSNPDKFNDAMAALFFGGAINVVDHVVYLNHNNREIVEFLKAHSMASDIGLPPLIRKTAAQIEEDKLNLATCKIYDNICASGNKGLSYHDIHRLLRDRTIVDNILQSLLDASKIHLIRKFAKSGRGRPMIKYIATPTDPQPCQNQS